MISNHKITLTNEDCFLSSSSSRDFDHLDISALHRLADVVEGDEVPVGGGQAVQEPGVRFCYFVASRMELLLKVNKLAQRRG